MQRDFLLPGGFGETLGNDVGQLQKVVAARWPRCIAAARAVGMTRHPHQRGPPARSLGLPTGEAAARQAVPADRRPRSARPHPRSAASTATTSSTSSPRSPARSSSTSPARARSTPPNSRTSSRTPGITQLIVTGVTTEVCVHTTVREANDRGYDALVLSDCVGSYFPEFQRVGLDMIAAQGGIFGWVADSHRPARRPCAVPAAAPADPLAVASRAACIAACSTRAPLRTGRTHEPDRLQSPRIARRRPQAARGGRRARPTPSSVSASTSWSTS